MTHKVILFHTRKTGIANTEPERAFLQLIIEDSRFVKLGRRFTIDDCGDILAQYPAHTPWLVQLVEDFLKKCPKEIHWLDVEELVEPPFYYIYEDDGIQRLVTMEHMIDANETTPKL